MTVQGQQPQGGPVTSLWTGATRRPMCFLTRAEAGLFRFCQFQTPTGSEWGTEQSWVLREAGTCGPIVPNESGFRARTFRAVHA